MYVCMSAALEAQVMAQLKLSALLAGKNEVVDLPPKRGPGRPKRVLEATDATDAVVPAALRPKPKRGPGRPKKVHEATEATDAVLQAIEAMPAHPEMLTEVRGSAKRRLEVVEDEALARDCGFGMRMQELAALRGVEASALRLPGGRVRRTGEGPQLKLRLCHWIEKVALECGGGDEVWEAVLGAAAEDWGKGKSWVRALYKKRSLWERQCALRGVTSTGVLKSESHLPKFLRKNRAPKCGMVTRAKGGGKHDRLRFLYPLVKEFFNGYEVTWEIHRRSGP